MNKTNITIVDIIFQVEYYLEAKLKDGHRVLYSAGFFFSFANGKLERVTGYIQPIFRLPYDKLIRNE